MRTQTHAPIKDKRGSKRPKLLALHVGRSLSFCQQEFHPRRKMTVSQPLWSPAYLLHLISYLGSALSLILGRGTLFT